MKKKETYLDQQISIQLVKFSANLDSLLFAYFVKKIYISRITVRRKLKFLKINLIKKSSEDKISFNGKNIQVFLKYLK